MSTVWKGNQISAPIVPGDDANVYPTHIDKLGAGGYIGVPDTTTRNNIPVSTALHDDGYGSGRRRHLMLVSVEGDLTYQLVIANYSSLSSSAKLTALADNSNWAVYLSTSTALGPGTAAQVIQYQSGAWTKTTTLKDSAGNIILDLVNSTLRKGSSPNGGIRISWGDTYGFTMFDSNGFLSHDYSGRFLWDGTGVKALDYNSRILIDSSNVHSANYDLRFLQDNVGTHSLDWQFQLLLKHSGFYSLDWGLGVAYDGSIIPSFDYTNRLLIDGSGINICFWDATKAAFQIDSTTKPFLPPRMTTTQKNAISSPTKGSVLFDTTLNKLCVFGNTAWETITSV